MNSLSYSVERHIVHLLYQEDSLDIPGFGRLDATRYGAEIQLESGLFLPPARRIAFSPLQKRSDVLVNHLVRYEGIPAGQARVAINETVAAWMQSLNGGMRLRLDGIGSFAKTGLQWTFQPAIEANFLPEAYGLPIFRATALSNLTVPIRTDEVQVKRYNWKAPLRAAAVMTGAISLIALSVGKADFGNAMERANVNPPGQWLTWAEETAEQVTDWWSTDAIEGAEETVTPTIPAPEADRDIILSDVEADIATPGPRHYLVVGAFSEQSNADRLVGKLQAQGFPALSVSARVGLTKVAVRTFSSRDEASAAKAELKAEFPAVWIYTE